MPWTWTGRWPGGRQGRGEPVVFLHGLGGSRTSWEPQLAGLSNEFRCIAWDMPGYGASAPVEPLTFAAIADAVARLLDAADVERAHLVGESFGGMHALHTALRHPERVARLVLANTSPAFGLDGTDPDAWRASRLAPLDAGLAPADIAEQVLTSIAGPALRDDALAMRVGRVRPHSGGGLASRRRVPSPPRRARPAGRDRLARAGGGRGARHRDAGRLLPYPR